MKIELLILKYINVAGVIHKIVIAIQHSNN